MMNTELQSRVSVWLKNTSQTLDISNLNLKKWPKALKGKDNLIIELDCSNNKLKSIPTLPNLTELICSYNKLKSIPSLPNLTELICSYNQLELIPSFPKLTKLDCSQNQLKSIPSLPSLTILDCTFNQLKSISSLPNLNLLYCSFNKLESVPNLHSLPNLTYLYCSYNQLESIPILPNLTCLYCSKNKLFSNKLEDWNRMWPLQRTYINTLQTAGIRRCIKTLKLRLYLPRLVQLHRELVFSPNHHGKFYKAYRWGNWSK